MKSLISRIDFVRIFCETVKVQRTLTLQKLGCEFRALMLQQGIDKRLSGIFLVLTLGKQHFRFDEHKFACHPDEIAGDFHIQRAHFIEISHVLVAQLRYRYVENIDLVL